MFWLRSFYLVFVSRETESCVLVFFLVVIISVSRETFFHIIHRVIHNPEIYDRLLVLKLTTVREFEKLYVRPKGVILKEKCVVKWLRVYGVWWLSLSKPLLSFYKISLESELAICLERLLLSFITFLSFPGLTRESFF